MWVSFPWNIFMLMGFKKKSNIMAS
jgi:hypothetical protein